MPRRWEKQWKQAVEIKRDFQIKYNRQPTDSEVASMLEITVVEWQKIKMAYQNREPVSLDTPVGDAESDTTCLADLVTDNLYRSFQLAQVDQLRLQQALSQLEKRTREILEFVFLQDLTQKQVAEQLDISVITVSRRVKKGLESLKESMAVN